MAASRIVKKVPNEVRWKCIQGMQLLSSRKDILTAIGNDVPYDKVDAILDRLDYPSGKWGIILKDQPKEIFNHFVAHLGNQGLKMTPYVASPHFSFAKDRDIDNCSVRLRSLNENITEDHIRYAFEEFSVLKIKRSNVVDKKVSFLLKLSSPEEAECLVQQKSYMPIGGNPVDIFWYNI